MHLSSPDSHFRPVFGPLSGKRVGFVRPDGNAGDDLIHAATRQLFAYFEIPWRDVPWQGPGDVSDLDVLAYAGGANMGRMWGHQERRADFLAAAGRAGVPVVLLPQSFHEPFPEGFAKVWARDRPSLAMRPDAELAPDLALGYDAVHAFADPDLGRGVLMRQDHESAFAPDDRIGIDPASRCSDHAAYLSLAARYEEIVTDRLHFVIAGMIAGRRVTLLPNSYHKNRGMWETWLRALGCQWADHPREAGGRASAPNVPRTWAKGTAEIAFLTTCRDRRADLQCTLDHNLALLRDGEFIIVLDYNCPRGTAGWARQTFPDEIAGGRLRVFAERSARRFFIAHAKNACHLLAVRAGAGTLVNLDADDFLTPAYLAALRGHDFAACPALCANNVAGDCRGRTAFRSDVFVGLGGFDEDMDEGHGEEAADLLQCAAAAGVVCQTITVFPGPEVRTSDGARASGQFGGRSIRQSNEILSRLRKAKVRARRLVANVNRAWGAADLLDQEERAVRCGSLEIAGMAGGFAGDALRPATTPPCKERFRLAAIRAGGVS